MRSLRASILGILILVASTFGEDNPAGETNEGETNEAKAEALSALCCIEATDGKASTFKKKPESGDPTLGGNVLIANKSDDDGEGHARASYNHETNTLIIYTSAFNDLHEIRQKAIIRHEMVHVGKNLQSLPADIANDDGLKEAFKNMNALYDEILAHTADLAWLEEYDRTHECDAAAQQAKDDQKKESIKNLGKYASQLAQTIQTVLQWFANGDVVGQAAPPSETSKRLKVFMQCVVSAYEDHVKPWNDGHAGEADDAPQPTKLAEGNESTAAVIAEFKAKIKAAC